MLGAEHGVGRPPTRTPAFSAASSRAVASAGTVVIGFSVHALAGGDDGLETSACAVGIVRLMTISTSGWSSTSWVVPKAGTLNSSARFCAASG